MKFFTSEDVKKDLHPNKQDKAIEGLKKELEQFQYIASHDLQEPLRAVISYCQLLQEEYAGTLDEKAHEYIHFAVLGAKRMQDRIDAMLTYSRISTHTKPFSEVDLNEVVANAIESLSRLIAETEATIECKSLPTIEGDGKLLVLLFQHLIENALVFCNTTPVITIQYEEIEQGIYEVAVTDNGIGMEQEYDHVIFTLFQRLHTEEEFPGLGAGLALCNKIALRHNPDRETPIRVKSEPGKGSTFYVILPSKGKTNG